jgi:hypothetical protein
VSGAAVGYTKTTEVETRSDFCIRMRQAACSGGMTPATVRAIVAQASQEGIVCLWSGRYLDAFREFSLAADLSRWLDKR